MAARINKQFHSNFKKVFENYLNQEQQKFLKCEETQHLQKHLSNFTLNLNRFNNLYACLKHSAGTCNLVSTKEELMA